MILVKKLYGEFCRPIPSFHPIMFQKLAFFHLISGIKFCSQSLKFLGVRTIISEPPHFQQMHQKVHIPLKLSWYCSQCMTNQFINFIVSISRKYQASPSKLFKDWEIFVMDLIDRFLWEWWDFKVDLKATSPSPNTLHTSNQIIQL